MSRSTRVAGLSTTPGFMPWWAISSSERCRWRAGLVVHADPVGPGVGKGGDELVGVLDHQVAIERQAGGLAQALDHRGADGDVGDEMAVHDVDVDDGAAAALGRGNLVGQVGEVGGEDGGKQLDHVRFRVDSRGTSPCPASVSAEVGRESRIGIPRPLRHAPATDSDPRDQIACPKTAQEFPIKTGETLMQPVNLSSYGSAHPIWGPVPVSKATATSLTESKGSANSSEPASRIDSLPPTGSNWGPVHVSTATAASLTGTTGASSPSAPPSLCGSSGAATASGSTEQAVGNNPGVHIDELV